MASKKRRRGHGEGSIYQAANGKWYAVLDLGKDDRGKRRRKKVTKNTRAEVARTLQALKRDHEAGVDLTAAPQTVAAFLEEWLQNKQATVKRSTWQLYNERAQSYIIPAVGHHELHELHPRHVQAFITSLTKQGLSTSVIQGTRSVLRQVMQKAFKWGLVSRNVVDLVDAIPVTFKAGRTLTPDEAAKVLLAAREARYGVAVVLALLLGLRVGEICGLQWADLDLDEGVLHIQRRVYRLDNGVLDLDTPKTKGSARTIPIAPSIVHLLETHQRGQQEQATKRGDAWQDTGFVVTLPNGKMVDPNLIRRDFKQLLARCDLPKDIRFHDLRHSAATLLAAVGDANPRDVMNLLGHTSVQMTLGRYMHSLSTD